MQVSRLAHLSVPLLAWRLGLVECHVSTTAATTCTGTTSGANPRCHVQVATECVLWRVELAARGGDNTRRL